MYPFRTSSVFRSRWMALLWAAGICWTAYDFAAPDEPETATEQVSSNEADALQAAFNDI